MYYAGFRPRSTRYFRFGESTQSHFAPGRCAGKPSRCPRLNAGLRRFSDRASDLQRWPLSHVLCFAAPAHPGAMEGMQTDRWERSLPCPDVERVACCAPLSLLSLASPGLAIRGGPVQRGEGSLDLRHYPLHPSCAPSGLDFVYAPRDVHGCANAASARMRKNGLGLLEGARKATPPPHSLGRVGVGHG